MHLGTIRVFAKSSVLSKCTPFFCLQISCDQTQGFTNMSFETYQVVVNEDHTSGCRRMASGNCAPAVTRRSQPWLCVTAPPDQIETFRHHKFSPRNSKDPSDWPHSYCQRDHSCAYVLFALLSPKSKILAQRQHL